MKLRQPSPARGAAAVRTRVQQAPAQRQLEQLQAGEVRSAPEGAQGHALGCQQLLQRGGPHLRAVKLHACVDVQPPETPGTERELLQAVTLCAQTRPAGQLRIKHSWKRLAQAAGGQSQVMTDLPFGSAAAADK